jgi:hypothetical protein
MHWLHLITMIRAAICCALLLGLAAQDTFALTIVRRFVGGNPGTQNVGAGNLSDIFNAAADFWEGAVRDNYTVTLNYGWAPVGAAYHTLTLQGGSPTRESEGAIYFNNSDLVGFSRYYLDPTPKAAEEFASFYEANASLGAGNINAARVFYNPTGVADSFEHTDLMSVALEQIGHALGLSVANLAFQAEATDRDIDLRAPLPNAGISLPLQGNSAGATELLEETAYGTLLAGVNPRERRLPSTADILAIAQLSQFTNVNVEIKPRLQTQLTPTGLRVSWTELFGPFRLEENTRVNTSLTWANVSQPVTTNSGVRTVTLPVSAASKFYRLVCP